MKLPRPIARVFTFAHLPGFQVHATRVQFGVWRYVMLAQGHAPVSVSESHVTTCVVARLLRTHLVRENHFVLVLTDRAVEYHKAWRASGSPLCTIEEWRRAKATRAPERRDVRHVGMVAGPARID